MGGVVPLPAMTRTFIVGLVLTLVPALGCGDDAVTSPMDTEGTSGTGSTGQTTVVDGTSTGPGTTSGGTSSSGTEGLDSTGTDTDDTDTDTDTDTGGPMNMGHTAHAFVNAGTVSSNASYRLVWTFGQETQNQNTMDSPGYTLHGGLVGAIE